ncbi:MAG: signal peptidase I [Actinomycetes bacterium]
MSAGLRRALGLLGTAASALLLGVVVAGAVVLVAAPMAAGARPLVVLSGSMSPTYEVGDVVVVRPVDPSTLQVGDVVTYRSRPGHPDLTTHRVAGVVLEGQRRGYVTRGDANGADDPRPVIAEQIRGTVWYSVPLVGRVTMWLSGETVSRVVDVVAIALLVYGAGLFARGARDRLRGHDAVGGRPVMSR